MRLPGPPRADHVVEAGHRRGAAGSEWGMTETDEELAALVRRRAEAAAALIGGDVRGYLALTPHADDYTLMPPYGGPVREGADSSEEALDALEEWFQGGEIELEVVRAHRSGDLAVLVAIERQHGRVGGLPDQDWSLRVTEVFRREGGDWQLMHRHADALTHPIGHHLAAALARGDAEPTG
jgi:ketosteroid isomerase-like protein